MSSTSTSKPGTSVANGVRTTMNDPVVKSVGTGRDDVRAGGAFNTPGHDMGGGGIPCHTFCDLGRVAVPAQTQNDARGPLSDGVDE